MILRIEQTTANGSNNFEISQEGQLLFRASTPFYKPAAPIGGDFFRKLTLNDANGDELLYTNYDTVENAIASSKPLSWIYQYSKQVRRYTILNNMDQVIGGFYFEQVAVADTKYVLVFIDRIILCYRRKLGKKEVVSFYENDRQIGQITKPNAVYNNLDIYYAHFLDGTLTPAIISLFTIYYDFLNHNHSGEIMVGWRKNVSYNYDKNSKMYNKDFIRDNFGAEEDERLEQFIAGSYKSGGAGAPA